MTGSKKTGKIYRSLLSNSLKKNGLITWRYVFTGTERESAVEKSFFLEFAMINPSENPDEMTLGFKTRQIFNEEDLQYALAGTDSAKSIQTEEILKPSFATVRFGEMGSTARHSALYFCSNQIEIDQKNFEIKAGNCIFTENTIAGFINVDENDLDAHPEYLCSSGYVKYNFDFEITSPSINSFSGKEFFWCPVGLKTNFSGSMNYNGYDYIVNPKTSFGYIEKFYGRDYVSPWFHLSCCSIQSIISGHTLFDSGFAVHGSFNDKISFIADFEGTHLDFLAEKDKFNCIWECVQAPKTSDDENELLHWIVSIDEKNWVIDVDIYSKVSDLSNRKLEMAGGNRKLLSVIETCSGYGEIKVFKKNKKSLEQIEYLRITKAFCQYGNTEEYSQTS